MKLLEPDEHELIGQWNFANGTVSGDETCKRVNWLISSVLVLCENGDLGWEKIYEDPRDKRHWLLTYPQGHLQGGGPPSLRIITSQEKSAKIKGAAST